VPNTSATHSSASAAAHAHTYTHTDTLEPNDAMAALAERLNKQKKNKKISFKFLLI
jgi:hypothetical protein